MKKKYLKAVHFMFWFIVVAIMAITLISIFSPSGISVFPAGKENSDSDSDAVESETFLIKQIETVEQEVEKEWYYFIATAYSANDGVQGTNSTTASGTEVREGVIAVDPDVIPLGTEIEIKDMGVFIAEDTGGKIKGNRIDIFFESKEEAKEFGRQGIWLSFKDKNLEVAGMLD